MALVVVVRKGKERMRDREDTQPPLFARWDRLSVACYVFPRGVGCDGDELSFENLFVLDAGVNS
jgi:hypothetical protein